MSSTAGQKEEIKQAGLKKRVLSSLVLAPAVLALLLVGGYPFMALIGVAAVIAIREFTNLVRAGKRPLLHLFLVIPYLGVTFGSFIFLRYGFTQGAWLALTLMLCVWASDTGAYATGKTIGGPKMAPRLSPKKTWAGLGGAMLFCGLMLVFLLYAAHFAAPYIDTDIGLPMSAWPYVFGAGLVLGAAGQAGDLFKSFYKRRVGVKDSGNLIPGHGGLLDRIDALLLDSPVFLGMVLSCLKNL